MWYACAVATPGRTTADLLARVPVFAGLGDDERQRIADVAVPRRYAAGEVVFHEGDSGDTCYVVAGGHARATHQHADGRTLTLATFGPGDIFGELSLFDDGPRSATIEAVDDLEAFALLGGDVRRLLRDRPELAVRFLIEFVGRLRATNERLTRQSFQTVQSRVAAVLLELVQKARREGTATDDVLITTTQAELAQLAGSSRESASRFIATLERAGVVTQGRGRLTVHDTSALERYIY